MTKNAIKRMIREAMSTSNVPEELSAIIDNFVSQIAEYWMDMCVDDEQYQDDIAKHETKLRSALYTLIAKSTIEIDALP